MHGQVAPPPPRDAFGLVVWENAAYLVADDVRARVFAALKKQVGLTPKALDTADASAIARAIEGGGMHATARAGKLKAAARTALDLGPKRLDDAVRADPDGARKLLKKFPCR